MSSDALVPMLSSDEALRAAEHAGIPTFLARLNIFRVLLRRPRYAKGFSDAFGALLASDVLDARLRELAIMRVAWKTGSNYEWTQHWAIAQQAGISKEELREVQVGADSDRLGEIERAVFEAVDVAVTGRAIPREVLAVMKRHLSDDALLELVAAIGSWSMVSTLLRSLEVPLEEGVRPWPPEGEPPSFD